MRAPVCSIAGGCRASPRPACERWWRSPWSSPLVAVVLAVARNSDVERPAAPPPHSPTPAPGALEGCVPSEWWEPPIVDEPIPREIASRFAIFRDPPPSGELPRDVRIFPQARKLYRGALTLRPRLDTGTRLRVVMIAADIIHRATGSRLLCPTAGPDRAGHLRRRLRARRNEV